LFRSGERLTGTGAIADLEKLRSVKSVVPGTSKLGLNGGKEHNAMRGEKTSRTSSITEKRTTGRKENGVVGKGTPGPSEIGGGRERGERSKQINVGGKLVPETQNRGAIKKVI